MMYRQQNSTRTSSTALRNTPEMLCRQGKIPIITDSLEMDEKCIP